MAKIGILGTGIVGMTIGDTLARSGHDLVYGTRDVAGTQARTEPDAFGNPSFGDWQRENPEVRLLTFAEAARYGDIAVIATAGVRALEALELAGPDKLAGKILIDVSNPLDFSVGFPPVLSVCNDDSLGEQIQAACPNARVVKTLNTINYGLMNRPELLPDDHNLFVSGDDQGAKDTVTELLVDSFGWKRDNIIDLGDITTSRGTEMLFALWSRLFAKTGNAIMNIKIVTIDRAATH